MENDQSKVKDVNVTINRRMCIYDIGVKDPIFVKSVMIDYPSDVNPEHVIFNTALDLYPNQDNTEFSIFAYKPRKYCLASTPNDLFIGAHPLINGIVFNVEFYANGNVRYRGFDIVQSGKLGTITDFVYSVYTKNGVLCKENINGSIYDVLEDIDKNTIS